MFDKEMRDEWLARERVVPISPVLNLAPEGLVLGAGTVLVAADGERRLRSVQGEQARVLALLSAAYGAAVKPSVLGNIERAAKCWREGDDCLAIFIHLAHTGLAAPRDPRAAACRLFVTDQLMKAGVSSRIVFEALEVGAAYIEAVEKLYNPEQPRVPAGSGRTSGEWTRVLSWLGDLTAEQIAELGIFAFRFGGAAAAFGLLFIPSPNKVRVEGEVPEMPGLRYSWNRDETLLHLTYGRPMAAGALSRRNCTRTCSATRKVKSLAVCFLATTSLSIRQRSSRKLQTTTTRSFVRTPVPTSRVKPAGTTPIL
jgi:hypothetical protein